jgi:geranylgeranyl diphosphate synthase type II
MESANNCSRKSVQDFLAEKAAKTEQALRTYCGTWNGVPKVLWEAMEYSLFAGGKRLRPGLVLGAAELVCGDDSAAVPAACAVEMIHTYSLIHDDLPAMDDDDLRRGKPTSHRVYGEATAILAGDALLTMAFDIAAQTQNARVVSELARAAGVEGMAGGQVLDLESTDKSLSLDDVRRLHELKTGALMRASVRTGAILAGASDEQLEALTRYGQRVGLAFQIADDILDVVGSEKALGKPVGSDAAKQKATYPALVGLERAQELAVEAADAAIDTLDLFGQEADTFRGVARFIVDRDC